MHFICVFIFCVNPVLKSSANRVIYDSVPLRLDFAQVNTVIKKRDDIHFVLSIKNICKEPVKIPGNYIVSYAGTHMGNIAYELVYLSSDTSCRLISMGSLDSIYESYKEEKYLHRNDSILVNANISPSFFERKGVYKIRFFSERSDFFDDFPPLSTGWTVINVLRNLCEYPDKEKD